uniref:Regulatory protein zeste n=1 Tax=Cacopsylla melanoneura TaxID=428564 RepID=A0A8D8SR72_9HEMI
MLPISKRPYSPPFSPAENSFLIELVQKHGKILEGKDTDANSLREKNAVWETLCEEFNAKGLVTFRNVTSLRNKWKLMKKEARKEYADHKRYSNGTGGGPPPKELSDLYYSITNITGDVSIEGGKGSPDCDYQLVNQTTGKPTINAFPVTNQVAAKPPINPSPRASHTKHLADSFNDSDLENLLEEVDEEGDNSTYSTNTAIPADTTVWPGSGYTTTMLKKQKSKPLRDVTGGNRGAVSQYQVNIEKKQEVLMLQEGHFRSLQSTQATEKELLELRKTQELELYSLRVNYEKEKHLRETEDFKKRVAREEAMFTADLVERTIKKKRASRLFELKEQKLLLEIKHLGGASNNNNE